MFSTISRRRDYGVTARHPFWVTAGEGLDGRPVCQHLSPQEDEGQAVCGRWVDSHELRPGDLLVGLDGTARRIEAVELREVESFPVCNLTVEGHHTFAVGAIPVLVHNEAFCDLLVKVMAKPAALIGNPLTHAHHIVMKTIPENRSGRYVALAQSILAAHNIPLLGSRSALRVEIASGAPRLWNMNWALNHTQEIHSTAYAKAVAKNLWRAQKQGGKAAVIASLNQMGQILQRGGQFWK